MFDEGGIGLLTVTENIRSTIIFLIISSSTNVIYFGTESYMLP